MKKILERTLSGILYLVLIIGGLLAGKWTFGLLFLLVTLRLLFEFYRITETGLSAQSLVARLILAALIYVLSFLVAGKTIEGRWLFIVPGVVVFYMIVLLYLKRNAYSAEISGLFFGYGYVLVPMLLMQYLVFMPGYPETYTHRIVLGVLVLIWVNDTLAYVCGLLMGRRKLFPAISPQKTWEGAIGGAVCTIAAAGWMHIFMGSLHRQDWIVIALVVSVFGVFGDLSESMLKRLAAVKDSGSLMPGHGGLLDRLDSLLFVIPVAFAYLMLIPMNK